MKQLTKIEQLVANLERAFETPLEKLDRELLESQSTQRDPDARPAPKRKARKSECEFHGAECRLEICADCGHECTRHTKPLLYRNPLTGALVLSPHSKACAVRRCTCRIFQ